MRYTSFCVKLLWGLFGHVAILLSGQTLHAQTRSTYISELQFLKDKYNIEEEE